ncbi:Cro/CI family transcriptional regulator [Lelliottia sp. V89_10]|uniref:Cro/CI family transcriptional regulator n=1 Tax=Lelliottia wanjuensis TaxID=3050585 RepID=UPI00249E0459|nr:MULTISPECIES: Cro/CI family transcriptional regulator [unclassified Lelliottia]MDI3359741.1 Cro/CI family transcriptional regulator [Lelliottia sp. V89_13]MDK9548699.1 Cro/CI family transcriptional regulator [Lelliottia sp. V89_5]MDK9597331.1 Cro/CI family transcriptional regulator [Lelliottia sp. V89_10]
MKTEDVIKHFGKKSNVARALKIARSSVSGWGELVPERRAARIEKITGGALKYDSSLYESKANSKDQKDFD